VLAGGDGEADRAIDLLGRLLIEPDPQRGDPEAASAGADVPESGRWTAEVLRARDAIRGGALEKVVLAACDAPRARERRGGRIGWIGWIGWIGRPRPRGAHRSLSRLSRLRRRSGAALLPRGDARAAGRAA